MTKIYQLPHPLDRPYQADVLEWILESDKKYLILCAPTGFGKSPLPAAMSIDFRTLVLVLHKSLQSTNYRDSYFFDILYGKGNYPCKKPPISKKQILLPGFSVPKFTAYDCGNPDCLCPYQTKVLECLESNRVCLNYAKFLSTRGFTNQYQPEVLFLDEGHNLPEIVTEFAGITLSYDNEFLQSYGNVRPTKERMLNYEEAMIIFRQLARSCELNKPEQSKDLERWRRWKHLHTKIETTNEILSKDLTDWFYETTSERLLIKPLTAKHHFKRFFDVADKIVLMSATIKPNIASRLGIEEDEYDFMEVPSVWPAPTRLVYDLNAPPMSWKNRQKPGVLEEHAKLIASVLDERKTGIMHVKSKNQAYELQDMLRYYQNALGQTFLTWIPSVGIGTEQQLEEWHCQSRYPGTYCISWSFHEGVDLGGEDINIMAKCPYVYTGSNYEKAKRDYDPAWALDRASYNMEQLFGRHQRGLREHYTNDKLSFIADGSWHGLKSRLSSDFLQRVRNWNGK